MTNSLGGGREGGVGIGEIYGKLGGKESRSGWSMRTGQRLTDQKYGEEKDLCHFMSAGELEPTGGRLICVLRGSTEHGPGAKRARQSDKYPRGGGALKRGA